MNPSFHRLSTYHDSFPDLYANLHDFRSLGYKISRTLFVHKRRIANAPNIGLCECGLCTRSSPCGFDWDVIRTYLDELDNVEEKLVYDIDLIDDMKGQVDTELSSCMFMLAGEEHSGSAGEDGGSRGDALYAFNAWWMANAEAMVEELKNVCAGLELPVFGKVKLDVDDMLIMNSMEAATVGGQLPPMNEYVLRSNWEGANQKSDDTEADDGKMIDQERDEIDTQGDSELTTVNVAKKEWIVDKSDFVGKKLFQGGNGNATSTVWSWLQCLD